MNIKEEIAIPPNQIIRQTKSTCPVCLDTIDAFVTEKEGKVILSKSCPLHGRFEILLSRSPYYYKKLDKFYFNIMDNENELLEKEIWLTFRCDIYCRICSVEELKYQKDYREPKLSDIEKFIKSSKANFFLLSGGEPTQREDLEEIIKLLKKNRKTVTMNSNGLKFTDIKYLDRIRKTGLDRLNLQFDGFNNESYKVFRGQDLLHIKLKVLENLKALEMPTDLQATIARNVNEDAVLELVDFAAKNKFINSVTFLTIMKIGLARKFSQGNYIMPDEIIDILEEKTKHKITRKNIYLFQKLHFAIKSLFSQRQCFYNQVYLLVRTKGSYEPIDKFLDLNRIEPWLDKYQHIYKKNRILSKIFLIAALPIFLLQHCSFFIIKELGLMSLSYFLKTANYFKTRRFFYIDFSTGCDPYKMDYSFVKNCLSEIVSVDNNTGELKDYGRVSLYIMDLERKHLASQDKKQV